MKVVNIVVIVVLVYVGIVVAFESLLGYFQPENASTITITSADGEGNEYDRVVARLDSQDKLYVAVNHWPRAWYYRVLDNPQVKITAEEETNEYVLVPITGPEFEQVNGEHALPVFFRFLTGFPPRRILRADPIVEG